MIEGGGGDLDKLSPREIREFHVFPGAQVILTEAGVGLPEPQPRTSDVNVSNHNKYFGSLKIEKWEFIKFNSHC